VDSLIKRELRTLRARSREQVARNDYARRYVQLLQSNIVGANGVALESQIIDRRDGGPDKDARKAVEGSWKAWGLDSPEIAGGMSWLDVERLLTRVVATDGEFLVRFVEGREAGPWGFRIQILDAELLDVDLNGTHTNGNAIRQGVEVDEWGAPVAYHILTSHNGTGADYYSATLGRNYRRIEADQILHGFMPEWVGQKRGIPWTATSLERLKVLGAYEEAALTHARAGAQSLGFFSKEKGAQGFTGDEDSGKDDGSTIMNLEPGEWNTLPDGVSIETYDPKYPSGEFRPFVQSVLKGISAGLGPAYTSLAQDLEGTSFAGGRMGLLEERELYRYLQTWLAGALHRPVFLRWLRWALLNDRVVHPFGRPFSSTAYDRFSIHSWRGKRWPWVDPKNDAQAATAMVSAGLSTESRILRELGLDPFEVWDERKLELKERAERGIRTTTDVALEEPALAPAPPAPDTDPPLVDPAGAGQEDDGQ